MPRPLFNPDPTQTALIAAARAAAATAAHADAAFRATLHACIVGQVPKTHLAEALGMTRKLLASALRAHTADNPQPQETP